MNNTVLHDGQFSITKEQLRQLTDPKVKEWFPEVFEAKNDVEATEQEVFEALKNEAVKRGFVEGVMFESITSKHNHTIKNFELDFEHFKKGWIYVGGWEIFKNGTWATIIPTITKSEAEKLLNKKIID